MHSIGVLRVAALSLASCSARQPFVLRMPHQGQSVQKSASSTYYRQSVQPPRGSRQQTNSSLSLHHVNKSWKR